MEESENQEIQVSENNPVESISWEASEYIHHDKDFVWNLLLVATTAFFSALIYLILKDVFSVVVIVALAAMIGIYGHRKPRTLSYQIDDEGLRVAERMYSYDQFKSFAVVDEGQVRNIYFEPLKRFMPPITVYFNPEDEESIKEVLSSYLPYRQRELDFVDRLFQKLRF